MTDQTSRLVAAAWEPTIEYLERSRLRQFMSSHGVESLEDWHAWANADIGRYWDAVVQNLELGFHTRYSQPLDLSIGMPWPEWFVGGGFNYVANALDRHANGLRRDQTAIIWEGDDGHQRSLTSADARCARLRGARQRARARAAALRNRRGSRPASRAG